MKIALTGHTTGLGRAIFDSFQAKNVDIRGYSRSVGYDLTQSGNQIRFITECLDHQMDTVILNAFAGGHGQINLLNMLYREWSNDSSKTCIVIGSQAADWNFNENITYAAYKTTLDRVSELCSLNSAWRLSNIKPGRMGPILKEQDVVNAILWVLDQPPGVLVRSITLRGR